MQAVNERELVERCRLGDERAFQGLVEAYKDLVFPVMARAVADSRQADALAEEVFARIHRGIRYARPDVRLPTWIYRIIVDLCAGSPAAAASQVTAARGAGSTRDLLEGAIAKLPVRDRVLVAAHGVEGVQHEALAEALEIPPHRLGTDLCQAKRRLRQLLATNG